MFPTLIPQFPINYPLPPLPYPNNQYPRPYPRGPQYPSPRSYPIVIVPEQQRPPIRRPFPKPDYLKPCICGGNVSPSCQQTFPCGIDQNNNNNYNYGSWISWDTWNLNFLG
uniref:Uncharacterized protein n=1 Tax=Panagrolaimus sp. PS1159 TaxID=55785 RepID=A0AC35GJY0_9BILA